MKQGVPMVALRVMTAKEFEHFAEHSIREYAKDIERSQNLDAATAIARSRESFNHSLGDGLATANHSFFCIEAGQSDNCQTVGYFWIYLDGRKNSVFVYDFEIYEPHRKMGFGAGAMSALKKRLSDQGVSEISLRVAADNDRARNLYDAAGFRVTGINMAIKLTKPGTS